MVQYVEGVVSSVNSKYVIYIQYAFALCCLQNKVSSLQTCGPLARAWAFGLWWKQVGVQKKTSNSVLSFQGKSKLFYLTFYVG